MLEIVDEGIISREPGRGAYMPIITPLPDGTLIACQHVGSDLGAADNYIEVLRSVDDGKTWLNEGGIPVTTGVTERRKLVLCLTGDWSWLQLALKQTQSNCSTRNRKSCSARRCCSIGRKTKDVRGPRRR